MVKKARMDTVTTQQPSQSSNSVSSSAAGCIQICEVDAQGRFVQIKNMSKSVSMCMLILAWLFATGERCQDTNFM